SIVDVRYSYIESWIDSGFLSHLQTIRFVQTLSHFHYSANAVHGYPDREWHCDVLVGHSDIKSHAP
ncbi:hypothetical protein PAK38_19785, partial [Proteus mirabilis]|uniref:hypothetical protein n=1 Tax=Proteus mirabilis TaxID=584 RepID=UPI002578BA37